MLHAHRDYTFLGPKRTPGPNATGTNDITDLPHF